jgi:hypothetical protein
MRCRDFIFRDATLVTLVSRIPVVMVILHASGATVAEARLISSRVTIGLIYSLTLCYLSPTRRPM